MSDTELIAEVAALWVARGGDAEGFAWLGRDIVAAIKRLTDVDTPEGQE